MTFIFGFYGFYRNADNYTYNFDIKSQNYKKYIYIPEILNEDKEEKCDKNKLIEKFGNDANINIYVYDKFKHINKCNLYCKDKFINKWYQQGYRIFSFFYNIKGVSELIKNDNYNPESIVILSRIDIGLTMESEQKIIDLLKNKDVIVLTKTKKSVTDLLFIFKIKHINIFIKLYDDYGDYITRCKNNSKDRPHSTRPEDIFFYHFKKHKLRIVGNNVIKAEFKHVCSKYCGHNGNKTLT